MLKRAVFAIGLMSAAIAVRADAFDEQVASIVLLQNQNVQKDLKITEAQRTKMNTFAEKFNKEQQTYFAALQKESEKTKKAPTRDQKKEVQMVAGLKKQILAILSQTQIVRLRQISLQAIGVAALADDLVAKKVGLTAPQITKIRGIVDKGLKEGQKISQTAEAEASKGIKQPTNEKEAAEAKKKFDAKWKVVGPPAQKKLEALRTKTINEVMSHLNAKQKSTWASLVGPMFKG
jgi:hypothetical protein